MKRVQIFFLVLCFGLSFQAQAKSGIADDEVEFVLAIIGLVIIVAGIYLGFEYLIRNGRGLFNHFKSFVKKSV